MSGPIHRGSLLLVPEFLASAHFELSSIGDHSARRGHVRLNKRAMSHAYYVGKHLDELEQRKYDVESERPADQPTSLAEI